MFLTTFARGLNSTVVDHPYFTDFSENMGERIWFAPSVFSYFSPGYRLNGVLGPELQIWSTATAMTRTNWVASLVSGGFGTNFTIDTTPYVPYGGNPSALVDTANALLMGGSMGPEMKASILTALQAATSNTDRIRTCCISSGRRCNTRSNTRTQQKGHKEITMKSRRQFLKRCCTFGACGAAAHLTRFGLMTAQAQSTSSYKALVCIFMFGGNDSNNMIVPLSGSG